MPSKNSVILGTLPEREYEGAISVVILISKGTPAELDQLGYLMHTGHTNRPLIRLHNNPGVAFFSFIVIIEP
jgi:hypothetical protein